MTATKTSRAERVHSPLLERFPALDRVPRVRLVERRTPIERSTLADNLWIKREDLAADTLGGNKVRSLEYLLGEVRPGDRVLTVGATGSTHALATVRYAHALGATAEVIRWPQEMNDCAAGVGALIALEGDRVDESAHPVTAFARVAGRRVGAALARERLHWIAAGGSTPRGALGHVDAALEMMEQVREGEIPEPERVVLALGSGGTAAGVALGLAIAGSRAKVIAVRVVPRIVANRGRVTRLAEATARLIERATGGRLPRPQIEHIHIEHVHYGGAYGRESPSGRAAALRFREIHQRTVDPTYTAKALAAALAFGDGQPTVFWSTFDARCIIDSTGSFS
jgi:D-cysteine desulfhydrase